MGIAVLVLWTSNAAISFAFPVVNGGFGSTGIFGPFILIKLISLAFVIKLLPETKGRTLEELKDQFREGHIAKRLGAVLPSSD